MGTKRKKTGLETAVLLSYTWYTWINANKNTDWSPSDIIKNSGKMLAEEKKYCDLIWFMKI